MKKYIKLLIIIFLFSTFKVLAQQPKYKLENGFYCLAENQDNSELVSDVDSTKIYGVEKIIALSAKDFKKSKILTINAIDKKIDVIEITLNKIGKKKWKTILDRISKTNEIIVFIFENKVILEKQIFGNTNSFLDTIIFKLDKEQIQNFQNKIQIEIKNLKFK